MTSADEDGFAGYNIALRQRDRRSGDGIPIGVQPRGR
jgi:hypothetical protein